VVSLVAPLALSQSATVCGSGDRRLMLLTDTEGLGCADSLGDRVAVFDAGAWGNEIEEDGRTTKFQGDQERE
jgi:hypothetical protein